MRNLLARWLHSRKTRRNVVRAAALVSPLEPLEGRQLLSAVIDLRLPGGGKAVEVTHVGQVVSMEIWLRVTGTNASAADDALQSATTSILSSNTVWRGAALGTLSSSLVEPFTGLAAQPGSQADLDADGDLDIGSNVDENIVGFFHARANQAELNGVVVGSSKDFKLGTATFTVTELRDGTTELTLRRRQKNGALWVEDLQAANSTTHSYTVGDPIVLTYEKADTADPTATITANDFSAGGAAYTFNVTYADDKGIDLATIDGDEVRVTGPNGYDELATVVNITGDVLSRTVQYSVPGPNGFWNNAASGTYTVDFIAGTVLDVVGKNVPATSDTFVADIPIQDLADPTAAITAPDVSAAGATYEFDVVYTDDVEIDEATIGADDVIVTGPNGYSETGSVVNITTNGLSKTVRYSVPAPGGAWNAADNGTYTVQVQAGAVRDQADKGVAAASTTFTASVDLENPTATINAPDFTLGGSAYQFEVTYSDDNGIDATSLGNDDVRVTGPNGYDQLATLVSVSGTGASRTALYSVPGPGGLWDNADNGTYTVAVVDGAVLDTFGKGVGAATDDVVVDIPVDAAPPAAAINTSAPVAGGAEVYTFTVTYTDDVAVDVSTITGGEVVVTGPNGYNQVATLVSTNPASNANSIVATYRITSPLAYWTRLDNGAYTITVNGGEVMDTASKAVPQTTATLNVNVDAAILVGGSLMAYGDGTNNSILISRSGSELVTLIDGVEKRFNVADVTRIYGMGYGGNDSIRIGKSVGNTRIWGGDGNDTLIGGDGRDVLLGQTGDDLIKAGAGADVVKGGLGNDRIYGGAGKDKLYGSAGIDRLFGDADNDLLNDRDSAKDLLDGGAGTDKAVTDRIDVVRRVESRK